jgi:hypothetical protein
MSNQKLLEATQLAPADFDLHFIQYSPHLFLRNYKLFSDFKAQGTGELPTGRLFQNGLFQSFTV